MHGWIPRGEEGVEWTGSWDRHLHTLRVKQVTAETYDVAQGSLFNALQ